MKIKINNFHHDKKNIDIKNDILQIIYFDKQYLPENNTENHKMSSTFKFIKKKKHENSFRKKLLREYITSQSKDPDLIRPYIDLEKYLLS